MTIRSESGNVTLEACISLLTFLILMLFLSSLFILFMAQNMTAHAILQTAQSLALDSYTIDALSLGDGKSEDLGELLATGVSRIYGSSDSNPYFVTDNLWYNGDSAAVSAEVRERFVGYLSGGDETKADDLLRSMNVVNGLAGLDFSQSAVSDGMLTAVVTYELEYDFDIWGVDNIAVEQKSCAQLWKKDGG